MALFTINTQSSDWGVSKSEADTDCSSTFTYSIKAEQSTVLNVVLSGANKDAYYTLSGVDYPFNDQVLGLVYTGNDLSVSFHIENSGNSGNFLEASVSIENTSSSDSDTEYTDIAIRRNDSANCNDISGGGDVSKVGAPVDNQIAVWTGDGTIEGDPNFTWDGLVQKIILSPTGNTKADGYKVERDNGEIGYFLMSNNSSSDGDFLPIIKGKSNIDTASFTLRGIQYDNNMVNEALRLQFSNEDETGAISDSSVGMVIKNWGTTLFSIFGNGDATFAGDIITDSSLFIKERASAATDQSSYGQVWIKNGTPNTIWFTDDTGTDFQLGTNKEAAGSDTQVQFNNAGVFGASNRFIWNDTDKTLILGDIDSMVSGSGGSYANLIIGDSESNINGNAYGNLIGGNNVEAGTLGAGLGTAVVYDSLIGGWNTTVPSAKTCIVWGQALLSSASRVAIVGVANVDLTQTVATQFTATGSAYNPRFIVGVGNWNSDSNTGTRKNGLVVMSDGVVSAPEQSISNIDSPTVPTGASASFADRVLITKEYGDANYLGGGAVDSVNGKTGIVILDTSDISENTNLYYTEARVSANTNVTANTAKVGITPTQASNITTNNGKISYTDSAAVALNTAKVGITTQQASDITDNNAKVSMVLGTSAGTALEGDTTTITPTQASDITTNNAKVGVTTEEENTINTELEAGMTGEDLVLNVLSLTEAEYNAGTPVSTTFYIITDA